MLTEVAVLAGVEVNTGVDVRVLVAVLVAALVAVDEGVNVAAAVGTGVEEEVEVGKRTKTLNSGPVGEGLLMPEGWAIVNPFMGKVSDPPVYVPLSTAGA